MKGLPWRSAAIVSIGALIGRVLGVGREAVFAHFFGANFLTDAYLVAILIPVLTQNVVAGGSLQAAFIPMVADALANGGRERANQLVADLFALVLVVLAAVTLAIVILAGPIVDLTAGGFSAAAATAATDMLHWCALLVLLNGFLAVALGALNTYGEFRTTAALSPVLNVVQIAVVVTLAVYAGIYAAVAGLLLGTLAQCLCQLPALRRSGIRLRRPKRPGALAQQLLPAFVPAALASLVAQGNPLADKVIGSHLIAGSITHLNYADLFAGSVAIVTTSVALVTFPTMSTALAEGSVDRALHVLRQAIHVNLLTAVPVSILLGAFAPDIVRIVYGWGRLSPGDLEQVSRCLLAYSAGIPFTGLFYVLLRACYAIKRPMLALMISIGFFAVHVVVSVALAPVLGPAGLAAGTASGAIVSGLGGWFLVRNDLLRQAGSAAAQWSARLALAACASIVAPFLLLRPWLPGHADAAAALWRVPAAAGLSVAVLVPLVRLLDRDSHAVLERAWGRLAAALKDARAA